MTACEELAASLPCRLDQVRSLAGYLAPGEPLPPLLFCYGDAGTGKSTLLTRLLAAGQGRGHEYAVVNLVRCYSARALFETVLYTLTGYEHKCENAADFVDALKNEYGHDPTRSAVIVLDEAERLRSMDANTLPVFCELRRLTGVNLCVVLLTDIVFERFAGKIDVGTPVKIHFPQYDGDELFRMICADRKSFVDLAIRRLEADREIEKKIREPEFFGGYLNAFLGVFRGSCRDPVELKRAAAANFVEYCRPICDGTLRPEETAGLWRRIAPVLRADLERPRSRLRRDGERPPEDGPPVEDSTSTESFARSFDLPFYAKYLLIAAYLASYNPAKEDGRLFLKQRGKRKTVREVNSKAVLGDKTNFRLGPKYFTLDRLLAVFYAILEERVGLTANLVVQVSSLVSLRLLSASPDGTKYRCAVGFDFVKSISRMVGFNVRKYLYDLI